MSMPTINLTEPIPLAMDAQGVIRVGGTRVTLDTVVFAYKHGADVEEIVERYPSLGLKDVYLAIGFYLSHSDQVEAYLSARREEAARIRQLNESRSNQKGLKKKLLARRAAKSRSHAQVSG